MVSSLPADTVELTLRQGREYNSVVFPLALAPVDPFKATGKALVDWAIAHRQEIEAARAKHGAVLLRGFGVAENSPTSDPSDATVSGLTPQHFGAFVAALGHENFPYIGGNAVRTAVPDTDDRVFTANESPPERPIPFHHELAQTPEYPMTLLFFCETPATTDGETPIVLSTAVYDALLDAHPDFVRALESHGVVYSRVMSAHDRPESAIGRGWRATFNAKTRVDVEQTLKKRGYGWEWLDPQNPKQAASIDEVEPLLREISPVLPAVREVCGGGSSAGHDAPSRKSFFNQLAAVWGGWRDEYNSPEDCVRSGNGNRLDGVAMEATLRIMQEHAVAIPWEKGDILYVDNMLAQHSRNIFTGPRRVLASLTK